MYFILCTGYTDLNPDVTSIDFKNVMQAFQTFQANVTRLLCSSDLDILRNACILQNIGPEGTNLPDEFLGSIHKLSSTRDLINQIVKCSLLSWMDIELIDAMAAASRIPEAICLVEKYKDFVFSKKVKEILPRHPNQILRNDFLKKLSCKINKDPDEVTVGDLVEFKATLAQAILEINKRSLNLESISEGCIEVHYYIPRKLVSRAYQSSLKNRDKFGNLHIRYLHFEGHDKVYSMECSKPDTYMLHCDQQQG